MLCLSVQIFKHVFFHELFFSFPYLWFVVSADVGNAPKARLGQVNARRRGPFVVFFFFLGWDPPRSFAALLQILQHEGLTVYLLPEWWLNSLTSQRAWLASWHYIMGVAWSLARDWQVKAFFSLWSKQCCFTELKGGLMSMSVDKGR